jgi:hypothetical protein
MEIVNKFKGLTGAQLLELKVNDDLTADIGGERINIVPRTMPFANQAEISSYDEATHVTVQSRFMSRPLLVRVKK